jgi:3-oxoacyl-[acyl-carrier protein] reductase
MPGRLDGKAAVVIGSGRGIGKVIARVFAAEGARVLAVGIHETTSLSNIEEIRRAGGDASFFRADITQRSDLEKMARAAVERYGRIDILCQNAGIFPPASIEDMPGEAWDTVQAVNLKGTLSAVKACLPQMKSQKYGRIVITSSITGPRVAFPGQSAYAASKAAVNAFIRTAALEFAGTTLR